MAKKPEQFSAEQAKLAEAIQTKAEELNLTISQTADLQQKVLDGQIKSVAQMNTAITAAKKIHKEVEGREILEEKILANKEKQAARDKQILNLEGSISTMAKDVLGTKSSLFTMDANTLDINKKLVNEKIDEIKLLQEGVDGRTLEGRLLSENLTILQATSGALDQQSKVIGTAKYEQMKGAFDQAHESANKLGDSVADMFDELPGGGFLSKALGLDNVSASLEKGINAGFVAMNAHIAQGGTRMGGLTAAVKAFNTALMVNPLLLVVAAGALLFTMLSKAEKKEREMAESTGMTVAETRNLIRETEHYVGNPLARQLATSEDILAVQQEMVTSMGSMGRLATGVAQQVAESGKAFGYGNKVAADLQSTFMSMGETAQSAADAQDEIAASAIKAGVNVGAVMADISKNSKAAQVYMGGTAEEIGKAAVEAAKLGVDLGIAAKVSDKLLDIETSLTAQFEFSALTGKQINLDKARQLALEGKIVEATASVLEQVGSIEEFNKLGVHAKKKLAEATGMEVDEIAKGLSIQKHRGKLTEEEMAAANGLNKSAADLASMSAKQIKAEIVKQRNAEKATASFQELITSLKTALMPLAEALGGIFGTFAPLLQLVAIPLKVIGKIFGFLFNGMGIFSTLLRGIVMYMATMWIWTKLTGGSGGFGGIVTKISSAVKNMLGLKKEVKATKDEAAGLKDELDKSGKTATSFKDKLKGIKGSLTGLFKKGSLKKMFGSLKGGISGIMGGLKGGIKGIASGLGGLAKSVGVKGLLGGAAMAVGTSLIPGLNGGSGEGSTEPAPPDNSMEGMASRGASYATGGTVGNTGVAKVHAGETITPAEKVPGSEPKGGGGVSIDYDKMTQAFIAAIQQMPAPQVNMDGKALSDSVTAQQSYNRGIR
jgi:hypothetical protein